MSKVRSKIIIVLFFISNLLVSQIDHDGLEVYRTTSNYGKVDFWVSRLDTFLIKNTTEKRIFILKQKFPRGFEVRIPRNGIEPGEISIIEVIYSPVSLGEFNEKLKLYHSQSKTPFYINFKGEVLSFDPYAQLACPSFNNPNRQKPSFSMTINVIDSISGEPLDKVLIELSKGEDFTQFETNELGVLNRRSGLGLFFIYFEKEGYVNKDIEHYFNPMRREITVGLVRNEKEQVIPDTLNQISIDQKSKNQELLLEEEGLLKEEFVYEENTTSLADSTTVFSSELFAENNIVFLIDVSASMRGKDRLELLKESMITLTKMLRPEDKVTIVTYSDEAQVALSSVSAAQKDKIINVIKSLKASGSTFGGKAIKKAYKILEKEFVNKGNNQIILATDGGFNGLSRSEGALKRLVKRKAKKNLRFSVLGFGKNRRGKDLIESLSVIGKGNYEYIEDEHSAKENLTKMIRNQSYIGN